MGFPFRSAVSSLSPDHLLCCRKFGDDGFHKCGSGISGIGELSFQFIHHAHKVFYLGYDPVLFSERWDRDDGRSELRSVEVSLSPLLHFIDLSLLAWGAGGPSQAVNSSSSENTNFMIASTKIQKRRAPGTLPGTSRKTITIPVTADVCRANPLRTTERVIPIVLAPGAVARPIALSGRYAV